MFATSTSLSWGASILAFALDGPSVACRVYSVVWALTTTFVCFQITP